MNFTGIRRGLHRHRVRISPVNFTDLPRVAAIIYSRPLDASGGLEYRPNLLASLAPSVSQQPADALVHHPGCLLIREGEGAAQGVSEKDNHGGPKRRVGRRKLPKPRGLAS
ncbi:hypothetical protein [Sorangium sp. So ce1182]|uniref:hypothetical protein n=1 Tax=Sorangium sp. So ce1182 TaxID=3133334 RepID=UPI003F5E04DC